MDNLSIDWIQPLSTLSGINQVPSSVLNKNVFIYFGSRELFKLRGVCTEWSDIVKAIWCQVVKNEMLEQVHSLDLLYERETTSKLLEFKLKYLVSYATLMSNYFVHMQIDEIVGELVSLEDGRGKLLVLFAANIVGPHVQNYPKTIEDVTPDNLSLAQEYMLTPDFASKFKAICEMSTLPEISLVEMKILKRDLIDRVVTPTLSDELGNAARLLSSWLDGILEFTILKHEVIVLRLKNNKVLD